MIKTQNTDETIAVITRGHTDRKVTIDDKAGYEIARKWAESPCLNAPASQLFRKELCRIDPVHAAVLVGFRGRLDDGTVKGWQQMGPPLPSQADHGRYNRKGESVLYMCDSAEGVRRELLASYMTHIGFIQRYSLDAWDISIADFTSSNMNSFLRSVFDIAESCNVSGRPGPNNYTFSQYVAKIVEWVGFDAMLVPGVRGDTKQHYRNIVVFDSEKWESWSDRDAGFAYLS